MELYCNGSTLLLLRTVSLGTPRAWSRSMAEAEVAVRFSVTRQYSRLGRLAAPPSMSFVGLAALLVPGIRLQWVSQLLAGANHTDENDLEFWRAQLCHFAWKAASNAVLTGRTEFEIVVDITIHAEPLWWLAQPAVPVEEVDRTRILSFDVDERDAGSSGRTASSSSSVKKLESARYGGGEDFLESSCAICLDDFEVGAEVSKTVCSHAFHRHCLGKWLQQTQSCPLCRSDPI